MRQLALAFRMLRKTPFVTAVAVLSLALGIGANAAIYSLFDQLLIRSLPVPEAGELVNLSLPGPMPGSTSCNQQGSCQEIFSYPMYRDIEREQTALASVAAHRLFGASLSIDNEPSVGEGIWVSGSYFPTLRVNAALGRVFGPDDDRVIGGHDVVVISHILWRDRFGARPDVIGKTMIVNGRTMEIIGVLPQWFHGATAGARPLVYVPLSMRGAFSTTPFSGFENRRQYWLYVFGRLKPGGSVEEAVAGLNATVQPILQEVEAPVQTGMSEQTLANFKAKKMVVEPGRRGQSDIQREAGPPLFLLGAITLTVLLIACANVANLLLARGAGRATEMGVRLALGASRRQLLSQLMTESLLLATLGGVVSLVIAKWTLAGVASFLPPEAVASMNFALDGRVMTFAAVLAIVTGFLFGLYPAVQSTRPDLIAAIRAGAGQIAGGHSSSKFRAALVTVQIALSMALLASAGLFVKSLLKVSRVDIGMDVDQVVTFAISPPRIGYDTLRSAALHRRVEGELRALPGVTGVTSAMVPLLAGSNWGWDARVEGFECGPDTDCNSNYNEVGPDYFTTLGVRLTAGRGIEASDDLGTTRVAVVNQAFADKFNLKDQAVGKFMGRSGPGDSLNILIVGVVPNVGYSNVKGVTPPVYYLPWRQYTRTGAMNFFVRTALPPEQLLTVIPEMMKRLEPSLPVEELKTMPQQIRENVFLDRMISILSTCFAVLATLLAAVGLYGVMAYSVAQRTREIGVRMALGANAGRVQGMVLKQVGLMLAIGGVVGLAAAFALGRAARSMLYEIEAHDPMALAVSVLLLTLVALAAGYLPARRASRVDPMHALRYD
ncbi:MAG: ABC transporter permease [Gemmatimonadaceae bacterium]|nr:ABC transporter permease [Gemmatimonadaceae bacterium]MCW5826168.1 ABC transporter permease [Gemmatimonadaceae bacterium]